MRKKMLVWTVASLLPIAVLAGNIATEWSGPSGQGDLSFKGKSTGTTNLAMGVNGLYNVTIDPSCAIVFGDMTFNNVTVKTNSTVGGKSTLNGELEVNGSDVDINLNAPGSEIDISQTNTAGTAEIPLMKINDSRTGATANTAGEASFVINAAGTYALTITNGILQVKDEIDTWTGNDLTIDPAGGDLIVDANIGALAITGTTLTVSGSVSLPTRSITATMLPQVLDGQIYVGSTDAGSNVIARTMGGDATIDSNGVLTVSARAIEASMMPQALNGQIYVGSTDAGSNVIARTMNGDATMDSNAVVTISARAVLASMMPMCSNGQMYVGSTDAGTNVLARTMNGDATIDSNATVTITARAVEGSMMPQITDGQLFVGCTDNGSNAIARTITGSWTINSNGVATLGAGSVTNSMLTDGIAATRITGTAAVYADVWGKPGITPVPVTTNNTVGFRTRDLAGNNLAQYRVLRVWIAETDMGTASSNNIEAVTFSGGTAVQTVSANADYWRVTSSTGTGSVLIAGTSGDITNFLMISDGSSIASTNLIFHSP